MSAPAPRKIAARWDKAAPPPRTRAKIPAPRGVPVPIDRGWERVCEPGIDVRHPEIPHVPRYRLFENRFLAWFVNVYYQVGRADPLKGGAVGGSVRTAAAPGLCTRGHAQLTVVSI